MRAWRWSRLTTLLSIVLVLFPLLSITAAMQQAGPSLDPANMDISVDPAEDFYRFANGGWLDRAEIPADAPSFGVFEELNDLTRQQQLSILEEQAASGALAEGSDEWKVVQLFGQGTDLDQRNSQGIGPIQPTLDTIAGIASVDEFHTFLQGSRLEGVWGLFSIDALPDLEDSSRWSAYLSGPQLWLPSTEYYLEEDPALDAIREGYINALSELLQYAGYEGVRAETTAQAVYEFEKELAGVVLTPEESQDISLILNPMPVSGLQEMYPLMDWAGYMETLGLPPDYDRVIVTELRYMEALQSIVEATDLDTLKDFLTLQLLWTNRIYLDDDIQDISFNFRSRMLFGLEALPPVEERVLDDVNGVMGFALGRLYVDEYFPPEAKEEITLLVDELVIAFRARIEANPWMSDQAKEEALAKLDTMIINVGYPDAWRGYEAAEIGDSYAASIASATNAEYERTLGLVGEPVDKSEWPFPPQIVNAGYSQLDNSITFPAGILQPPFFEFGGDHAANLGGIGLVIGHEITHGFDLQGSQFDAEGNLRSWWTDEDQMRFDELNQRVADHYGAIEILPGLNVDGQVTVTENVADLGGIQIAFDALMLHLQREAEGSPVASPVTSPMATPVGVPGGTPAAITDMSSFTPEQRFFIAAATIWRDETRDEYVEMLVRAGVHSPSHVRGVVPLQHMDEFHEAFDIQPGDPMYLPPEDRIVIW